MNEWGNEELLDLGSWTLITLNLAWVIFTTTRVGRCEYWKNERNDERGKKRERYKAQKGKGRARSISRGSQASGASHNQAPLSKSTAAPKLYYDKVPEGNRSFNPCTSLHVENEMDKMLITAPVTSRGWRCWPTDIQTLVSNDTSRVLSTIHFTFGGFAQKAFT